MNYFLISKEIKNFVNTFFLNKSKKVKKKIIKALKKINKETNSSFFKIFKVFANFFQKNDIIFQKNNYFIYYLAVYGIIFFNYFSFNEEIFFYLKKILNFKLTFKVKKIKVDFKYQNKLYFFNFLDYYLQIFVNLNLKKISNNLLYFDYYFLIYFSLLFIFIGFFHKYLISKEKYNYVVFFLEIMQKIIKYSKKINLYCYNDFIKNLNSLLPKI